MDKSAEIKPKFFWYRDTSPRIRKVQDKRIRPWWNVSSPLSRASCISRRHLDIIRGTCQLLYTDIYFLAYLLRPSGSLADCTTLLCPQPPRSSLQPLHFAFQRTRTTQGKHNRESFVTVTRSSNYFPDKTWYNLYTRNYTPILCAEIKQRRIPSTFIFYRELT